MSSNDIQSIEDYNEKAKEFIDKTSKGLYGTDFKDIRWYILDIIEKMNKAFILKENIAVYKQIDNCIFKGIKNEYLGEFARYDYTITALKLVCKHCGYILWIKEQEGKVHICVSDMEDYSKMLFDSIEGIVIYDNSISYEDSSTHKGSYKEQFTRWLKG